jgi:hypothetical protein
MTTRSPLQETVLDIVADGEIDPEAQTLLISYTNLTRLIRFSGLGTIENCWAIIDPQSNLRGAGSDG